MRRFPPERIVGVDTIILRCQEFSGGGAVLDGDGRSFGEITAQRCDAKERPAAA